MLLGFKKRVHAVSGIGTFISTIDRVSLADDLLTESLRHGSEREAELAQKVAACSAIPTSKLTSPSAYGTTPFLSFSKTGEDQAKTSGPARCPTDLIMTPCGGLRYRGGATANDPSAEAKIPISPTAPVGSLEKSSSPPPSLSESPLSKSRKDSAVYLENEDAVGRTETLHCAKAATLKSSSTGEAESHRATTNNGACTTRRASEEPVTHLLTKRSSSSVGIGRFRHAADAHPSHIKAMIDKELSGPESHNFFGPQGLNLGTHPLILQYNERKKSFDAENPGNEAPELSPTLEMATPAERLAWKMRTKPSTTWTSDGGVVQKGFVIGSHATPRPSSSSTSSQDSGVVHEDKYDKPSKPNLERRPSLNPPPLNRIDDEDLFEAAYNPLKAAPVPSLYPHAPAPPRGRTTSHGLFKKNANRSKSAQTGRKVSANQGQRAAAKRDVREVRIVDPKKEEADNAIESDSDSDWLELRTPVKPRALSKDILPPAKGILKKAPSPVKKKKQVALMTGPEKTGGGSLRRIPGVHENLRAHVQSAFATEFSF